MHCCEYSHSAGEESEALGGQVLPKPEPQTSFLQRESSTVTYSVVLVLMEARTLDAKGMFFLNLLWFFFLWTVPPCDDPLLCSIKFFIKCVFSLNQEWLISCWKLSVVSLATGKTTPKRGFVCSSICSWFAVRVRGLSTTAALGGNTAHFPCVYAVVFHEVGGSAVPTSLLGNLGTDL